MISVLIFFRSHTTVYIKSASSANQLSIREIPSERPNTLSQRPLFIPSGGLFRACPKTPFLAPFVGNFVENCFVGIRGFWPNFDKVSDEVSDKVCKRRVLGQARLQSGSNLAGAQPHPFIGG